MLAVMVPPDVVDAYHPFRAMGAVLELVRLPAQPASQATVVQAMNILRARRGRDANGVERLSIDPDVASGARVLVGEVLSFGELLGPGYDLERDELRLFTYSPKGGRSSTVFEGLAHALLAPPYGLRRPSAPWAEDRFSPAYGSHEAAWMRDVLRAFCREVLAVDDPRRASHLAIRRWPTDWSSYFAAGHEWWGAFFWTIEDPQRGWTTVIAASTTD